MKLWVNILSPHSRVWLKLWCWFMFKALILQTLTFPVLQSWKKTRKLNCIFVNLYYSKSGIKLNSKYTIQSATADQNVQINTQELPKRFKRLPWDWLRVLLYVKSMYSDEVWRLWDSVTVGRQKKRPETRRWERCRVSKGENVHHILSLSLALFITLLRFS